MQSTRPLGAALTAGGLAGYLLGLATAYPGRAFSITLLMIGITLYSIDVGGTAS